MKTQGSLPSEGAALVLLFGLIATGQIRLRKIDGYKKLPRGLPHAISAGLYLGLGEGIWLVGF